MYLFFSKTLAIKIHITRITIDMANVRRSYVMTLLEGRMTCRGANKPLIIKT